MQDFTVIEYADDSFRKKNGRKKSADLANGVGRGGLLSYNLTYHVSIKENFLGYFAYRVFSPILATERMAAE